MSNRPSIGLRIAQRMRDDLSKFERPEVKTVATLPNGGKFQVCGPGRAAGAMEESEHLSKHNRGYYVNDWQDVQHD